MTFISLFTNLIGNRNVAWCRLQEFIDISVRPLCPFCKCPAGLEDFTLEGGTDILFQNVDK